MVLSCRDFRAGSALVQRQIFQNWKGWLGRITKINDQTIHRLFYAPPDSDAGGASHSAMTRTLGWLGSWPRMLSDATPSAKCCPSITGNLIHRAARTHPKWPSEKSATFPSNARRCAMNCKRFNLI